MSALLKIPLSISSQNSMMVLLTAPSSEPASTERVKAVGMERIVPVFPAFLKALTWFPCICEVITISLAYFVPADDPNDGLARLADISGFTCWRSSSILVTPLFLLGWVVSLVGAFLRVRCYQELGHHFTFALSIRKNHELITSGPYSFVRHPSYTASYIVWIGVLLTHLTEGSWVTECLGLKDKAILKATFWVVLMLMCIIPLATRMDKEDKLLKAHFGKEWDQWREKVPYRLIPWMY